MLCINPLPELCTLQGILRSVSICEKIFDGGDMMNIVFIDCLRNGFSVICSLMFGFHNKTADMQSGCIL